jgi:protein involved in polysaccharide export with SLBB domain
MIGKYFRLAAVVVVGLQVAGCYTDYGPVAASPEPMIQPASVATRLQAGDKLKVTIYGEEALSGIYQISPSGDIAMPLVGTIKAAGRTRTELEREIARRYASGKYLQEPKVTVDDVELRPIYVVGEALRPGSYPYTSGLNVLTALAVAGGPTYRASRDRVFIQHAGESVWQEYPLTASVVISPGDLIRIPERYF